MRPRAYAFRVHALGGNVGGWTIQRYFSRVVNCRVAFAARRLSTFAAPEEEIRAAKGISKISEKPLRGTRKSNHGEKTERWDNEGARARIPPGETL